MLYLTGDNISLIILETANIEEIKKGRPAITKDGKIIVAWTPDPVWLADQIARSDGDPNTISRLVDESTKRPQKDPRPYHKTITTDLTKKDFN